MDHDNGGKAPFIYHTYSDKVIAHISQHIMHTKNIIIIKASQVSISI